MSRPTDRPRSGTGLADDSHLENLLRRCSHGDEPAFAEFYDATISSAWGLAVRVVRSQERAEEAMQEAYRQTWHRSGFFEPTRARASAWFLTIVHRTAVDRVRIARASPHLEKTHFPKNDAGPTTAATALEIHDASKARPSQGLLDDLTDQQRQAIELAYWGGYTHTEVAIVLGLPAGSASASIREGLIRLRDALGDQRDESGA